MQGNSKKLHYDDHFFSIQRHTSYVSASTIVPYLVDLIQPSSVIDIGCGLGTWLKVFTEKGVVDILGVDGEYIAKADLYIDPINFISKDITKPFDMGVNYDLVISLEVGEHIAFAHSDMYIDNLTKHGKIIFFSAAIPFQGGTNHINEQWQSFWAKKFISKGYVAMDCVRRKFWDYSQDKIQTHYIQNSLLYVHSSIFENHHNLSNEYNKNRNCIHSIVHPQTFLVKSDFRKHDVQSQLSHVFKIIKYRFSGK